MKNIKISLLMLAGIFTFGTVSLAEDTDSLGVIGDNFDLYAVLDAFKNAETVEAFEQNLNDPTTNLNNLDLDEDGEVDYIQVIDNAEGDAHALILRVALSETEFQDVAVVELEKTKENTANVQIVGDEEIYGADYIVEPVEINKSTERLMTPNLIIINVWGWRCVRHIYGPKYVRWVSPWGWRNHPKWWRPWKPVKWRTYHGHHRHHRRHYHVVHVHHVKNAHGIYHKNRRTSAKIKHHKHHHSHHNNGHNGHNHNGHNHNGHNHKNGTQTNNTKGNQDGQKNSNKGNKPTNKGNVKSNNGPKKSTSGGHKKGKGGNRKTSKRR
jgi:hypothetical protein